MSDPVKPEMKTLTTTGGRYIMLDQIGRGGMGQVWSATRVDGKFYKSCAIKILHSALAMTEDACERFLNETRIAAQLDHPAIVRVIDMGMLGDAPFLVMDRVDGVDVRKFQKVAGKRLGVDVAVFVVGEVLAALEYAHDRTIGGNDAGVVHSDVTPGNIMISSSGDVRLTDFGIARFASMDATMTRPIGTQRYMSPEQRLGKTLRATDIFSLGVIFHELLEGARYLGELNDHDFTRMTVDGHVPDLVQTDIPDWVDTLRRQMLSANAADRPRATDARAIILKKAPQYMLASKRLEDLYKQLFGSKRSGLTKVFDVAEFFGEPGPSLPELGPAFVAQLAAPDEQTPTEDAEATPCDSAWVTGDSTGGIHPLVQAQLGSGRVEEPAPPSMLTAELEPEATAHLEPPFADDLPGHTLRLPAAAPRAESAPALAKSAPAPTAALAQRSAAAWVVAGVGVTIIILLTVLIFVVLESNDRAAAVPTAAAQASRDDQPPEQEAELPSPEPLVEQHLEPAPELDAAREVEEPQELPELLDDTTDTASLEAVPAIAPEPKAKPKPIPRVAVVIMITKGPPEAEIELGTSKLQYKSVASTKLRPGTYKVRWRAKPDGPWHGVGSLTVEALPSDQAYDIRLSTTAMTVQTTRRGSAK